MTGEKRAVKKASDYSDVEMFASILQFGTLVKLNNVYSYSALCNRLL